MDISEPLNSREYDLKSIMLMSELKMQEKKTRNGRIGLTSRRWKENWNLSGNSVHVI